MMKKLLVSIGLAPLLLGCAGNFAAANAAPAPLFDPVLDDIRRELPAGWQFRLPASIPGEGDLYPFISEATDTKLVISLGMTPDCNAMNCTIGMIGATDAESVTTDWPPEGRDRTSVSLTEEVDGYHLLRGEGPAAVRYVMWQQDGLVYAIATLADALPQDELVSVARSMATESPISR
ncbi:hypothetical protein [Vacuolonema iberomarrocanum]|uniref:hypothetical protein n=1 Tax=Vacuolonema iberomarrocanum TaxID=3454632 RepID=UPI0019FBF1F5|nr:hypothetical protein [filamentous cyanobacterium LEGE 07170]